MMRQSEDYLYASEGPEGRSESVSMRANVFCNIPAHVSYYVVNSACSTDDGKVIPAASDASPKTILMIVEQIIASPIIKMVRASNGLVVITEQAHIERNYSM